ERAVSVYVRAGSQPLVPALIDNSEDLSAGETYANAANSIDNTEIDAITRLEERLADDRAERVERRDELESREADLQQLESQLEGGLIEEQLLLEEWGAVPVMGASQLTADQIAGWFRSTGVRANLPASITVDDLAKLFVDEGALAGVKGDVAFAQSVIET